MIGDFNDIKGNHEKEGGVTRSEASFALFRSMISISRLHDLKSIGGYFTWNGHRSKYNIRSRIDRAMASCDWLDLYLNAHVKILPWIGSDHRPLLVDTESIKTRKRGMFRNDNQWRLQPEVKKIIHEVWNNECLSISPEIFYKMIEKCRGALSKWRSKSNANTEKRICESKAQIQEIYQSLDIDVNLLNNLKAEFVLQYRLEEEYWHTKGRIQWLRAGDKNTKFFHAKTKQRRSYSRILPLTGEDSKEYTKPGDIHKQAVIYFNQLYTSEGSNIDRCVL